MKNSKTLTPTRVMCPSQLLRSKGIAVTAPIVSPSFPESLFLPRPGAPERPWERGWYCLGFTSAAIPKATK